MKRLERFLAFQSFITEEVGKLVTFYRFISTALCVYGSYRVIFTPYSSSPSISLDIHVLHSFTSRFYFQREGKLLLWWFSKPYSVTDEGFPFPLLGHWVTLLFLQVVLLLGFFYLNKSFIKIKVVSLMVVKFPRNSLLEISC